MASLNQVMTELSNQVQLALTAGAPTHQTVLYRGWPDPNELKKDLINKVTNISFAAKEVSGSRMDMPIMAQKITTPPVITLTATASSPQLQGGGSTHAASATVTFGGTATAGLNLLLQLGTLYVPYHPGATDTPTAIATGFAAAVNLSPSNASVTATVVGPVMTITYNTVGAVGNTFALKIGVGGTGSISRQSQLQKDMIEIHIWTYNDDTRDLLSDVMSQYLSDVKFLNVANQPPSRLIYDHRLQADHEVHFGVYRRILFYAVQYSTVRNVPTYTVLEGLSTVAPA